MKRHDIKKKRLEKVYYRTIAHALNFEIFDPRLKNVGLVIERVEVDDEITFITIYFSLENLDAKNKVIKTLYSIAPFLNHLMEKQVKIKTMPRMKFFYDYKTEKVNHVLDLIDNYSASKKIETKE